MKKLLIFPLLILSASLAFADSCEGKDCSKDKKDGKSCAFVETATFAGAGCGDCGGDKKDKKDKAAEESFTFESESLLAGGCGGCGSSCGGDKKDKKDKKEDTKSEFAPSIQVLA